MIAIINKDQLIFENKSWMKLPNKDQLIFENKPWTKLPEKTKFDIKSPIIVVKIFISKQTVCGYNHNSTV